MILAPTRSNPPWYHYLWRVHRRQRAKQPFYQAIPREVMVDLAAFCCATAPTPDPRSVGRRDVWLRIMHFRQMDDEELAVLYANLTPEQRHQLWSPGVTYMEEE